MRRSVVAALTLAGALSAATTTTIASADCCSDALSCLGAFLSAGISCQVQSIIDTVKALQDMVNGLFSDLTTHSADLIGAAKGSVNQAAADLGSIATQATQDLNAAAIRAHGIANPSAVPTTAHTVVTLGGVGRPASAAAAPPQLTAPTGPSVPPLQRTPMAVMMKPADPAAVRAAQQRADNYVQGLKAKQDAMAGEVSAGQNAALAAANNHVAVANQLITAAALDPLRLMGQSLADMLLHPDRLFDPSAQIDADVQRIQNDIAALLDRITNEIVTEPNAKLDAVRPVAAQMQDHAQVGQHIADLMNNLAQSNTQGDLDALNAAVPVLNSGVVALRGVLLPTGLSTIHPTLEAALARSLPKNVVSMNQRKTTITDIGSKWAAIKVQMKAPAPRVDATFQQRADQALTARFQGKTKTDVQKEKQALEDDAKRRFASDPKTLQKVIAYIESH